MFKRSDTLDASRAQASGSPSILPPLKVIILRADIPPNLKVGQTHLGTGSKFYVTVTSGPRTWKSRCERRGEQVVEWNQSVDAFDVPSLSRIMVYLYAKRTFGKDILVGKQEIASEHEHEIDINLSGGDGHSGHPMESVTLFITITTSAITRSTLTAPVNTRILTAVGLENVVVEGDAAHPIVQSSSETMQPTTSTARLSPLPQMGDLPNERSTPVGPVEDRETEMRAALSRAEEAMNVMSAMSTWDNAVDNIKRVMDTVTPIPELGPYAELAWSLLSKIPETLLQQVLRDDDVRELFEAIRDAFDFRVDPDILRNIKPESAQANILRNMLECVSELVEFIKSYANDAQAGKRTSKGRRGQVRSKAENYRTTLVNLRDKLLARAAVMTEVSFLESELDARIRELPYKGGWRLGDSMRCLPGTREDFLHHIIKWVENPKSNRGLVLVGQAGTGKSSVAHEIARYFDGKGLGSYFAFLRKEQSKDEAYQLFTTIVRDLSDRYPPFKHALGRVIKDKSSLRNTRNYRTLFESLLLEPLNDLATLDPILIVIDGLDESGDAIGNIGLHTFLACHLVDLPSTFRVLITSRPEDGVEAAFSKESSVNILYMDDAYLAVKTEQDIFLYLQHELPRSLFEDYGPQLAKAAESSFLWAAVVANFVNSPPANFAFSKKKYVQRLLGHSRDRNTQDPLDKLYEEILERYFKPPEAQILFRSVMGQLFAAIEPLSIQSLITLRRHAPIDDPEDSDFVLELLRHLGSLLSNVTSSDLSRPVVPLHTSFRDFLTNEKSGAFCIDLADAHHQLAHSCLGLMLDKLKFNICQLESSYLANSDVPDLLHRIDQHIPAGLSYACHFWDDHLEHTPFETDLFTKLRSLFETKFLFWLEVLSVKSKMGLASLALSSLSIWLQHGPGDSKTEAIDLLALANDASTFVRYFGMAMARSAPHIYLSALPFAPSSSHIIRQYLHLFPQTFVFGRGQLSHWPALQMVIQGNDESVESVAFSPDGLRIASTSWGCTIRVWDATTGEAVAGPFTGDTEPVLSVAFSPDGKRIASASFDNTIRVWDAATGDVVAGPFRGHTDSIRSIAFSPDGRRIASTSDDSTIRMWEAATGEAVAGPLLGHTGPVFSAVFSPGGQRIASASEDRTIRVWDAATGGAVASPFTGHTGPVFSVVFSPGGRRIASASGDSTIRVWDAVTGEAIAGPFTGHTDSIRSIALSPDGQRIASASFDRTICVWDSTTGEVAAGPFLGHADSVLSVAFSPDGRCIASGSKDRTIRLWDATTGEFSAASFTGHTDSVSSVAFSPDGCCIASASRDRMICVWSAATGEIIAGPFTGHTGSIRSVAFSPDGRHIASASNDRTIRVWDAATGKDVNRPFIGHTETVLSAVFSPDGRRISSASGDSTIRVWDAATGEAVAGPFIGHTEPVFYADFSPDGRRISSASWDSTIRVWDAATGEIVAGPFIGHTGPVFSAVFSPDGQRIASASGDFTVRVWDAATGEAVAGPFTGHTNSITSVAFSPNGQSIASASFDRTIRVWDATTGEVAAGPFLGHIGSVLSVAFSPDGRRIASGSDDCTIRLWDVTTGESAAASSGHTESTTSALRDPTALVERARTEDNEKTYFMNKLPNQIDGWMCDEEGDLLLWVPPVHRPYFHRSNTVWIAGKHETCLDFSKFVHGSNWATVYVPTLSK